MTQEFPENPSRKRGLRLTVGRQNTVEDVEYALEIIPSHVAQLERLNKRRAGQQLVLDLDEAAKTLLSKEGYDPQFGARPLRRTIQELLLDNLASRLLEGEFKAGDHIHATAHDGELVLRKA